MRLNKYIAQAGITSRRKADELTQNGNVKVNGIVIKELGFDVKEGDIVEVNGAPVKPADAKVYIAMNKPKGYITSLADEKGRPIVTDLITDIEERLFPIGRLDNDTSGLLLLTNDGELANKLMHPRYGAAKTYRAKVSGFISNERLARLRGGVDIGGYVTGKARVEIVRQAEHFSIVEITIREGKNRQIKKMFTAVGNKVIELERTAVGDIVLGRLKEGHYRKLTRSEIEYLRQL